MAASFCTVVLLPLFFILVTSQGCVGKMNQSLKEVTLSCAMQGFNAAMKSLEDTMINGLRAQREHSDALGLLIQDVDKRLQETQRLVEHLENKVDPNSLMEAYNKTIRFRDCSHPKLGEITELVMDFNKHRNWTQLRIGLEAILDHETDVYSQLQYSLHFSNSQIFWIGFYGHTQLASILLCGGLPVDIDEPASDTMLHGAAEQGHVSLVKLLLDFGADINRRGISGMTPIMRAASWGKLEMVKVLAKAGANTTRVDSIGRTALQWATTREKAEVVKFLQQLPH